MKSRPFLKNTGNPIREFQPNTFLKAKRPVSAALFLATALTAVFFSGCGPKYTYPANTVPEAIEGICKKEYNIDVVARVVGKTVGAVLYMEALIDAKGQVPKEVHEQMGKVMQVVTRVALSTDRPIDFCTVFIRDKKDGNELIITRSLDDTKRANADAIGVEESINRTIFGQSKYRPGLAEKSPFILKEITLESFLADQVAQRVKFNFSKESKDPKEDASPFALVDGHFSVQDGKRMFRFSVIGLKAEDPNETVLSVLNTARDVFKGYKFDSFDIMEIQDYLNRQKLTIDPFILSDYIDKKITDQEILTRYLSQSQSIQEAFKLFGFNLSQDSTDETAIVIPAATATP